MSLDEDALYLENTIRFGLNEAFKNSLNKLFHNSVASALNGTSISEVEKDFVIKFGTVLSVYKMALATTEKAHYGDTTSNG